MFGKFARSAKQVKKMVGGRSRSKSPSMAIVNPNDPRWRRNVAPVRRRSRSKSPNAAFGYYRPTYQSRPQTSQAYQYRLQQSFRGGMPPVHQQGYPLQGTYRIVPPKNARFRQMSPRPVARFAAGSPRRFRSPRRLASPGRMHLPQPYFTDSRQIAPQDHFGHYQCCPRSPAKRFLSPNRRGPRGFF